MSTYIYICKNNKKYYEKSNSTASFGVNIWFYKEMLVLAGEVSLGGENWFWQNKLVFGGKMGFEGVCLV